jgi:hypothetical protein
VYVASQIGHTDPNFTLRVYAQAVRHRSKLTPVEREAFDRVVEWAQLGANLPIALVPDAPGEAAEPQEPPISRDFIQYESGSR